MSVRDPGCLSRATHRCGVSSWSLFERFELKHSGGNPGANLQSIPHRCYLREVAFEWELTKESIYLPLGCLQGGEEEEGTRREWPRRLAPKGCELVLPTRPRGLIHSGGFQPRSVHSGVSDTSGVREPSRSCSDWVPRRPGSGHDPGD